MRTVPATSSHSRRATKVRLSCIRRPPGATIRNTSLGALVALWLAVTGARAEITMRFTFPADAVTATETDGFLHLALNDGWLPELPPGQPALPARYVNFLLPAGAEFAALTAQAAGDTFAENAILYPAQPPRRPGVPPPPFAGPDPAAYASAGPTPAAWAELAGIQEMRGRRLVTVRLNPLRYYPAARRLELAPAITVTVQHRAARQAAGSLPMSPLFGDLMNRAVVNPEPNPRGLLPATNSIPYIILTRAALTNAFATLAAHRQTRFPGGTAIVTVEEVLAAFPGRDDAEKIRQFVIQAVQSNGTDFVVLGGDDTVVPARMAPIAVSVYRANTPVDLYYAGLAGDWDANHNNIFGELDDEADMMPDVVVSRIPIRTAQDADRYTAKLIAYETGARADVYGKLFLSGTKGWDMIYGSARGTDPLYDAHPSFQAHQPVSDAEHWVRRIHRDVIQTNWSACALDIFCDTLTSWDQEFAGDFQQTPERFVAVYNQGWEHQYYDTHGNWDCFALENQGRFQNAHAAAVTNLACFITSVACLTAHFDGTNDPCLAETFLRNTGGALVYHGCARLGWGEGYPDYYGGPSPAYAIQYLRRLFDGSCTSFGAAYALGKIPFIGLSTNDGTYRWLQFGINLLGDAAIAPRANPLPAAPRLTSAVNTLLPVAGIDVAWADRAANAAGFDLQRAGGTDDAWRVIATTGAGITNYFDSAVTDGEFYLYRVRATNAAGPSIWSGSGGLYVGNLQPDAWDPADDAAAGATRLTNFAAGFASHGLHTLSAADTNDWFEFAVVPGYVYQFTTQSASNHGGLYARAYDGQMNLAAEGGDTNGFDQFALYLAPTSSATWRLCLEPNRDRDSASYQLFYRAEEDHSSSAALGAALAATQLAWRTSTAAVNPWFAQTNVCKFGGSAVQSGQIYRPDGTSTLYAAYSWVEAAMELTSPAFLTFWHKTELDPGAQLLLNVPGWKQTITATEDWNKEYYCYYGYPSPTVVTMHFELAAADSATPDRSSAWLDQVQVIYSNDIANLPFGPPVSNTLAAGRCRVYGLDVAAAGHVILTLGGPAAIDVIAYGLDGFMLTTYRDGATVRFRCAAPGRYHVMLENNVDAPAAGVVSAAYFDRMTYYVKAGATNSERPYASWATAAATIQDAVEIAFAGDLVLVTNGVYDQGGNPAMGYDLTNRVAVDKALAVRSVNGPAATHIVGQPGEQPDGFGLAAIRGVFLAAGAEMSGFSVTGGYTHSFFSIDAFGGGVYSVSNNTLVSNCVIMGNAAWAGGAGAYRGTLRHCVLARNTSTFGGGGAEDAVIEQCRVTDNAAGAGGGGYHVTARNSLFAGNQAEENGGGLYESTALNCTLVSNQAGLAGGLYGGTAVNSIAWGNLATGDVAAANWSTSAAPAFAFCCTVPLPPAGPGNTTNDPRLAEAGGDWPLAAGSPCINAGTNEGWMAIERDLAGNNRVIGPAVDMGAYEFPLAPTGLVAATAGAGGCLSVSWSGVSGSGGYAVYRSTSNVPPGQALANVTTNAYCDGSARPGQHYYYWVAASFPTGPGALSSAAYGWLRSQALPWLMLLLD